MCCVGFEPPNKGGSVQGLGDWKAPVCATRKNPQPMKQSEINPSPATSFNKKCAPVAHFLFNVCCVGFEPPRQGGSPQAKAGRKYGGQPTVDERSWRENFIFAKSIQPKFRITTNLRAAGT